ncbi:hypothetical protein JQ554_18865 [Bradyrhizobium diazoefficiens]|jgi:hypothetical protein|nr:hypothetical protein [Bradyrhizobium diazoefficiens]UCF54049.1 MAG: hypothetical protein JSV48_06855 [Bradyrhizobium sp.]MBR0966274.1 hypothetical protein [Bradyrhizobium diazoefficiens]MBR0979744.1 hypothetical protein [Bradyrhizobium diazoefficiens]MBR1009092.1 hypothetical protein [Bradyrhizobium diazoefficiens]MBR1012527.1 hypothetical protein [Bradyrhizobium diazoefficiens]
MRRYQTIGLALVALCGASTLALARPPTVMNSPGYDRRLQESRSQAVSSPVVAEPATAPVVKPKRSKKKQPD